MFKSDRVRRDLALHFAEKYQQFLLPPGVPFNDQSIAMVFRSAFLMADTFLRVEDLEKEDLLRMGQPQMFPPPHPAPNGNDARASVTKFPQTPPKAS